MKIIKKIDDDKYFEFSQNEYPKYSPDWICLILSLIVYGWMFIKLIF